ncbi:MAG TPA: hypothetical protein VEJ67_10320 [Candidatus Cybelea sp.]|nr:hypothetical protein [Candidatus Cybelea sp.]
MRRIWAFTGFAALLGWSGLAQTTPARAPRGGQEQVTSEQPGAVSPSTRFLVRLDDALSTKDAQAGAKFKSHTLEPLSTPDGWVLPAGAEVRGHVDKVERAHQAGHARMWLTFDDVRTPNGWLPLVATVMDVPGVHSVRVVYEREGEIENRTSKREEQAEAAAAGAVVGAAAGVAAHNGKDAAMGAAAGAMTAFMLSSGLGQDVVLDKSTKLELILDRPLYLRN